MKVTALGKHECYCCGELIGKGDECFVFFVTPSDPAKNEFDVIYTCLECAEEEKCRARIKQKNAKLG